MGEGKINDLALLSTKIEKLMKKFRIEFTGKLESESKRSYSLIHPITMNKKSLSSTHYMQLA